MTAQIRVKHATGGNAKPTTRFNLDTPEGRRAFDAWVHLVDVPPPADPAPELAWLDRPTAARLVLLVLAVSVGLGLFGAWRWGR